MSVVVVSLTNAFLARLACMSISLSSKQFNSSLCLVGRSKMAVLKSAAFQKSSTSVVVMLSSESVDDFKSVTNRAGSVC